MPNNEAATRWRRAARDHQARWREAHGWPVGSKKGLKRANPFIGSTINQDFARATGANFLTPGAWCAAQARLASPQTGQTLDTDRLYGDLLSSMPLAFNLFGPLTTAPSLAVRLARRLFGDDLVPDGTKVEVQFEWSPGRSNLAWTGDRTAADVAVLIQTPSGRRHLVCIETKYHEASTPPATTIDRLQVLLDSPAASNARRQELSTGLFTEDAAASVPTGELEQLWRDHLLALSCLDGVGAVDTARYMLVAPAANPVWTALAIDYTTALTATGRSSFEYITIEEVLDRWGPACYWSNAFRARYLDIAL